ncbi:MAG: hypothetical protein RBS55_12475 [Bacteroidales bacterium]|jgi:hypothetical protein|nr:hypothetical protein [Bacteroidales bacterium]
MKRTVLFFTLALFVMACSKQNPIVDEGNKWNGYEKYLKMGEQVHTLWAGKNINVGTATYGIDNNANFYVTYDCSASGWTMSETHMFAGDKADMPLNKPGHPKIGQFPNSGCHNPRVSTITYTVPLSTLPPCEEPGFVVASHCVVYGPNGKSETAWAEGDFKFTDKGWGWYDVYYFNQPVNEYTILYGTNYTNDSLHLYHIDATNGGATPILSEYVGNSDGTYDGAAYDTESTAFLFVKEDVQDQLWVNILSDELPSFYSGTLDGQASSATFNNGSYIYVDADDNTIKEVVLNEDWTKGPETIIDEIPVTVTVNDIAMDPDGGVLYILGEVNDGGKEMISYDMNTETFYSMDIDITSGAQIAFGSDGILYAVAPITEGGSHSMIYMVDLSSGTLTPIEDEIIIIDDPFSDLSTGPIM